MSKIREVRCDACDDVIGRSDHLRLRRLLWGGLLVRLHDWGIVNYTTGCSGWRKRRVDICEECWGAVLEEVGRRCVDD